MIPTVAFPLQPSTRMMEAQARQTLSSQHLGPGQDQVSSPVVYTNDPFVYSGSDSPASVLQQSR